MKISVKYTIRNQYFLENVVKLIICLLFRFLTYTITFSPKDKNTKNIDT